MKYIYLLLFFTLITINSNAQTITTVAGNGTAGFSGDGAAATSAELNNPFRIGFDAKGNMYIADGANNRIRKVSTHGIITTVAGNGTAGFSGDGGTAISAELSTPTSVAVDSIGNLFITDYYNDRIRKVDTSGVISTYAGTGSGGYNGDGIPATTANLAVFSCVIGDSGYVYIADQGDERIRKVNSAGIISTVAGSGVKGYSGDGSSALAAEFYYPADLCFDKKGNYFIDDNGNEVLRKVSNTGIITTYAGNGVRGYSGDSGLAVSAELDYLDGVAVDAVGNVYIADSQNNRIRKVDTTGIITTVVGTGVAGYSGDGGPAVNAELNEPIGVTISPSGDLYIADYMNNRIRKMTIPNTAGINSIKEDKSMMVSPNPASDFMMIQFTNNVKPVNIELYTITGQEIWSNNNPGQSTSIEVSTNQYKEGIYILKTTTQDGSILMRKVEIIR